MVFCGGWGYLPVNLITWIFIYRQNNKKESFTNFQLSTQAQKTVFQSIAFSQTNTWKRVIKNEPASVFLFLIFVSAWGGDGEYCFGEVKGDTWLVNIFVKVGVFFTHNITNNPPTIHANIHVAIYEEYFKL